MVDDSSLILLNWSELAKGDRGTEHSNLYCDINTAKREYVVNNFNVLVCVVGANMITSRH